MKIVVISGLYPPYTRGGAEWVAHDEAQKLKEEGHEVAVITTKPWEGFGSLAPVESKEDGVRVFRFFPFNFFSYYYIGHHLFVWRALWHLVDMVNVHARSSVKQILEKENPDCVITHNCKGVGFLIPRLVQSLGIRHVHTLHDVQLAVPSGLLPVGKREGALARLYSRATRWLFGVPSVVRAPSQWLFDFYDERGFFKDTKKELLQYEGSVAPSARAQNNGQRQRSVLFVGQLEKHKGILFLLHAWKELMEEMGEAGNGIQLHCAGGGPLLNELKIQWEGFDFVVFHGFVTRDVLARLYGQVAAVVVPSLVYENAPTVIHEAHSYGVPVIATRAGGIPEMAREGDVLIEAGDGEALKRALMRALTG